MTSTSRTFEYETHIMESRTTLIPEPAHGFVDGVVGQTGRVKRPLGLKPLSRPDASIKRVKSLEQQLPLVVGHFLDELNHLVDSRHGAIPTVPNGIT